MAANLESGPPAGSATIPIADLESLFERIGAAERRAEQAEARLREAGVEARFMSGQLAELRRQVQAASVASIDSTGPRIPASSGTDAGHRPSGAAVAEPRRPAPAPAAPPAPEPLSIPSRPARVETPDRTGLSRVPPVPSAPAQGDARPPAVAAQPITPAASARLRPVPSPPPPQPAADGTSPPGTSPAGPGTRPRPATTTAPPERQRTSRPAPTARTGTQVDSLAFELRRLYARLDDYRREPTISATRERQRERDLGDYDTVLLRACSALSIATGLRPGEAPTVDRRGALTQALARAGLDVRTEPKVGRGGG